MKCIKPTFHFSYLLPIGLISALFSCRPTESAGHYELRHFPKTSIDIKDDGTFEFTKINPNPYLHSFEHPEDYYFVTSGTWTIRKNKLTLTSSNEPLTSKDPEIIESKEDLTKIDTTKNQFGEMWTPRSYWTFTFYDIFGDTVNVLNGRSPDNTEIFRLHQSMKTLRWSTVWNDTLEFHFYGYRPFKYTRIDKARRIIKVRLYPDKVGSVFKDKQFVLKRNRIIDRKIRFEKKNARAVLRQGN
ncbi:MAG TPA: hypothetical protein VGQ59_13545 [Cyclobacteriaceae bacterium]|nr:hypothetical protein [Cyclobacteriaceae bacterium]